MTAHANNAVAELIQSFGFPAAAPIPEGHAAFFIEEMGEIDIEEHSEELIVSLSRTINIADDRLAIQKAALNAVRYINGLPMPAQALMNADALIFVTRLSAHEADLSGLDSALQMLSELQQETRR